MTPTVRHVMGVLLLAGVAGAEERLGVLEFFVRGGGTYCQQAAPAVRTLQAEMAGRAVLLEYAYDTFNSGRVDRWWAAYHGPSQVYLPLVMVGSGLDVAQGPVDYLPRYRGMIEAELARPPGAMVKAWSRRVGDSLQVLVRATNLSGAPLTPEHAAAFWVVVWEDNPIGLTQTWVRATTTLPLASALQPGDTTSATIDVPSLDDVDWPHLRALAMIEHRPGGGGSYDMLQAAITVPAGIEVTPSQLTLGPSQPSAELTIDGPGALYWTATPEVSWLQVAPVSGALPGTCTVTLVGTPPAGQTGTVRIDANGGEMAFSATVTVTTQSRALRLRRHLARVSSSAGGS